MGNFDCDCNTLNSPHIAAHLLEKYFTGNVKITFHLWPHRYLIAQRHRAPTIHPLNTNSIIPFYGLQVCIITITLKSHPANVRTIRSSLLLIDWPLIKCKCECKVCVSVRMWTCTCICGANYSHHLLGRWQNPLCTCAALARTHLTLLEMAFFCVCWCTCTLLRVRDNRRSTCLVYAHNNWLLP